MNKLKNLSGRYLHFNANDLWARSFMRYFALLIKSTGRDERCGGVTVIDGFFNISKI